jgi:hypothetical protein
MRKDQPETLQIFVCETFEVVQEVIPVGKKRKPKYPIKSAYQNDMLLFCETFFPRGPSIKAFHLPVIAACV